MADVISCPRPDDLQRFLLGSLPEADANPLQQHLALCAKCLDTLHSLEADDTLLAAMRAQRNAGERSEDAIVAGLVAHLGGLHAPAAQSAPGVRATEHFPTDDCSFLAPAQGPEELGWLGGYRVLGILGAGGMGIVFEAEDPRLKRRVALKVMKPALAASESARQRFEREAQAIAALEHDHIVAIHQVGVDRGLPFLAMPLLKGETLEDRLKRAEGVSPQVALPLAEILRVTREIATGLAAAHAQGLTHRDIKPANIWLENSGRVKILDFGLARAEQDDAHLTQTGNIAGTPQYMAPEQAAGQPADQLSDLFSLGCVLYRLLTSRVPFRGPNTIAVLRSLALDQPQPPHELRPKVPPALSDLTMRLLSKIPGKRPQSAVAVVEALAEIERREATLPVSKLNRRVAVLASALFVLVAGPLGVWYGPGVYRIATNQGQLVIQTDDADVEVTVKQNGKLIKIVDRKTGKEVTLKAGAYQLELSGGKKKADLKLETDHFTLTRGSTQIVKVWREPAERAPIAPALPSVSPEPRVAAPPSPSSAPASPDQPFVIQAQGGRAEAQFGTLAEAIEAAKGGDTIEIRGNGPFALEPILISVPLTIRAGTGFQPVLHTATMKRASLLQVKAPGAGVVMEGLEIRRDNVGAWPVNPLVDCTQSKLRMAHCRVRNLAPSFSNTCGTCELRHSDLGSLHCICTQTKEAKLIVDRCLVTPDNNLPDALRVYDYIGNTSSARQSKIVLRRSTLVGSHAVIFATAGFPGFAPAEQEELTKMAPVLLEASHCLFVSSDAPVLVYRLDDRRHPFSAKAIEIADVAEANKLLHKLLSWRDTNCLFAAPGPLLGHSTPGSFINYNPQADVSTIGQWEEFWSLVDTHSSKQQVKFAGWDTANEKRSPFLQGDDFRLRQDSPGKKAGLGGSDLGADIDQLGPGPAYERWKLTAEYQEWLKAAASP